MRNRVKILHTGYLGFTAVITTICVGIAYFLPITTDEAYYITWGKSLSPGYFDHPAGVAVLSFLADKLFASSLHSRWPSIVIGVLTLLATSRLYFVSGLRHSRGHLLALVLFKTNLAIMMASFLNLPDTLLILMWVLALQEGLAATVDRKRWLSAGLLCGIGLSCKYTMVLVAPIFAWLIYRTDPKAMKTHWPYTGALIAVIAFSPNLIWNAKNEWVTLRHQLGRFANQSGFSLNSNLPIPKLVYPAVKEGASKASESLDSQPLKFLGLAAALRRWLGSFKLSYARHLVEFMAGQLLLWGFLLIPIILSRVRKRRRVFHHGDLNDRALVLLGSATLVPLAFFGIISIFIKVEANWAALYLLGASPLLVKKIESYRSWTYSAATLNIALLVLATHHSGNPILYSPRDRILKETSGFKTLSTYLSQTQEPIFGDTYQLTSMLRYYSPHLDIGQWPRISRDSHFTFAKSLGRTRESLSTGFTLITSEQMPPKIKGFSVGARQLFSDCYGSKAPQVKSYGAVVSGPKTCRPIHKWQILEYKAKVNNNNTAYVHRRGPRVLASSSIVAITSSATRSP